MCVCVCQLVNENEDNVSRRTDSKFTNLLSPLLDTYPFPAHSPPFLTLTHPPFSGLAFKRMSLGQYINLVRTPGVFSGTTRPYMFEGQVLQQSLHPGGGKLMDDVPVPQV